ncbi:MULTISPECIES: hypothetical protein [Microvirga]|uniref:hypothetical protein n=1 Tax=Microvirga TaxID=186650 RepID=UPI0021C71390|nr:MULTISPECIES: hypothetical protein [unclassified Microvirga]
MTDAKSYAAHLGDDLIRQAANLSDLNASCALLQNAVGITDGGIAAHHFSGSCPDPDNPETGDPLDWEDAWPVISPSDREKELRAWLALEDSFREGAKDGSIIHVGGDGMTYLAAANDLKVGDVVTNTKILETYPTHFIEPGARFVVVGNDLDNESCILDIRLTPLDAAKMTGGNLQEWGNCVQFYGPEYEGYENDPGIDPSARQDPGNMWTKATIPLQKDNDLLPLDHRVAAVFTYLLAEGIRGKMAEVVRRNGVEQNRDVCHSHDFCDANMVMASAMAYVLGRPTWMPFDWEKGRCTEAEHEADMALWGRAWDLAKDTYFLAYERTDDREEVDEDNGATENPPRYEAIYSQRGDYWYIDLRDEEGGTTVAGANRELGLTEQEAQYIADRLNQGDPLVLVLALAKKRKAENPLAAPLLELLQYVGGWDHTDPEHPIVKARLAYEGATGSVLNGPETDVEFRPLTDTTVWRHCRQLGVNADYCILYQRAEGYDGWSPFATCAPETVELIKRDGIRAHAGLLKLFKP